MNRFRTILSGGTVVLLCVAFLPSCRFFFSDPALSVRAEPAEAGTVTGSPDGAARGGALSYGTRLTLRAEPEAGWAFSRWEGDLPDSDAGTNPLELTVRGSHSLTAVFVPRWNFLVYLAADNNLEPWALGTSSIWGDLQELTAAGLANHVEVLVLFDGASDGDSGLYRLARTGNPRGGSGAAAAAPVELELVESYGELDTGDPATLRDFLVRSAELSPAGRTVLTLWNHGTGVYPRSAVSGRAIGYDDTSLETGLADWRWNGMETDEVAAALGQARAITGVRPDIIHTDACLMQMLEIVWEWRDETSYLVGSTAEIPATGNDYTMLMRALNVNPGITPKTYAGAMADALAGRYAISRRPITVSAVTTGPEFDELRSAFIGFASALRDALPASGQDIAGARAAATEFSNPLLPHSRAYEELIDLGDFLAEIAARIGGGPLGTAAARLSVSLQETVIHHRAIGVYAGTGATPASGLSILFPPRGSGLGSPRSWAEYRLYGYGSLRFSVETAWDEFLDEFYGM
jgi:hypothetical protein